MFRNFPHSQILAVFQILIWSQLSITLQFRWRTHDFVLGELEATHSSTRYHKVTRLPRQSVFFWHSVEEYVAPQLTQKNNWLPWIFRLSPSFPLVSTCTGIRLKKHVRFFQLILKTQTTFASCSIVTYIPISIYVFFCGIHPYIHIVFYLTFFVCHCQDIFLFTRLLLHNTR